jgi:hypothetical protein
LDGWTERVRCPFYLLEEVRCDDGAVGRTDPAALHLLTVLEGSFELEASELQAAELEAGGARPVELRAGATVLVPASTGRYRLHGRGTVVRGRPR